MASSKHLKSDELFYHNLYKSNCRRFLDFFVLTVTGRIIRDIIEFRNRKFSLENPSSSDQSNNPQNIDSPLVSVIVPTKNEESVLSPLLSSIRNNSYKNVEIVVSDYKSTDNTLEIAKAFRAKIVPLDRPGIGYGSHLGAKHCSGSIIIRTDADAVFPDSLISETVRHFVNNNQSCVYHVSRYYYDGSTFLNFFGYLYDKHWRKVWNTSGHFIAFRKNTYERIGGFDASLFGNEDFDFGQRAYDRFDKIGVIFDHNPCILVSSRRIKLTGLLRYIMGKRNR